MTLDYPAMFSLNPSYLTKLFAFVACCFFSTALLQVHAQDIEITITPSNPTICLGQSITLTAEATGGTGVGTFTWLGALNFPFLTVNPTETTTYEVVYMDQDGTTATAEVTVTVTEFTVVPEVLSPISCNGETDGVLGAIPQGTPPYNYAWSTGSTTEVITNLGAGFYELTVTDGIGCAAAASLQLQQPAPLDFAVTLLDASCIGSNDGGILAPASGGTSPYNYLWEDGFTEEARDNLEPGVYTISVTDANGCSFSESFEIENTIDASGPEVDFANTIVTPTNCGEATGAIDLTVTSGTPPYQFGWDANPPPFFSTDEDIANLEARDYTVFIFDENGCNTSATFTVEQEGAPFGLDMDNTIIQAPLCAGFPTGMITLVPDGGIPPFSFQWNDGSQQSVRSSLPPGIYAATITDAFGCSLITDPIILEDPEPLIVDLEATTITHVTCPGAMDGSIDIILSDGSPAPGGYELTLLHEPGQPAIEIEQLEGLGPGIYNVVLTNPCHVPGGVFIIEEPQALVYDSDNSIIEVDCQNATNNRLVAAFSGGVPPYEYSWSDGSTTNELVDVPVGTYDLTVTDQCGNTNFQAFQISDGGQVYTNVYRSICAGETVTVGGETFTQSGFYEVFLTTTDGLCDSIVTLELEVKPLPVVSAGEDLTYCIGGGGLLTGMVTAGASYEWSPVDGLLEEAFLTPRVRTNTSQTYTLTASLNGCVAADQVVVTVSADYNPIAEAGEDQLFCGAQELELGANAVSSAPTGNPADEVSSASWWNLNTGQLLSGGFGATASVDSTTTFELRVRTGLSCETRDTVVYTVSPSLDIATTLSDVSCPGQNDGQIELTISGGTPPLSLEWLDDPTAAGLTQRDNLAAGEYPLQVTDALDCTEEFSFTINDPLVWDVQVAQPSCTDPEAGRIELLMPIDPSWEVNWSNGAQDVSFIENLAAGDYCVTIILTEGCLTTRCYTIENLVDVDCATVSGVLRQDANEDCVAQSGELPLQGWLVEARTATQSYFTLTDNDGNYSFSIPVSTYSLHPMPPGTAWDACEPAATVTFPEAGEQFFVDLSAPAPVACAELVVELTTPFLRRCFSSTYFAQVCNVGSTGSGDYTLELMLDDSLRYLSAGIMPTEIEGQLLRWSLPNLAVGQCLNFPVQVEIACGTELGETHCSTLQAFGPEVANICQDPDEEWSGASLELSSRCENGEVVFTVLNNGSANLTEERQYLLLRDSAIVQIGSLGPIPAAATETISTEADGATYSLRLQQAIAHPLSTELVNTIEGCGTDEDGGISVGITALLDQSTGTPASTISCENNIGAYDPNDKTGKPLGFGVDHKIFPGTEIHYTIRFQNTGTDTAFLVVIRDQLAEELDLASFRAGQSSHDYELSLREDRELIFTFPDIQLPDSTTNLAGSQGFVDFYIRPEADLALGTPVYNEAAIYFDFNEPIITNTTLHTVDEDFLEIINWVTADPHSAFDPRLYPNPASSTVQFVLDAPNREEAILLRLLNSTGQVMEEQVIMNGRTNLDVREWPSGMYLLQLFGADGQWLGTAKFMRQ